MVSAEHMGGEWEVGRVLRSSTARFTIGCQQLIAEQNKLTPRLGALIKATGGNAEVYGFIYNVTIEDDAFVRQLVAAGVTNPVMIEDQRQKRQVPVVIEVMTAGYCAGGRVYRRLPPQPPRTLDVAQTCSAAEVLAFTAEHDWLRMVLNAPDIGSPDQIIVAALLAAAGTRPRPEQEDYLVDAGRELARLLSIDVNRLEGILRQLRLGAD